MNKWCKTHRLEWNAYKRKYYREHPEMMKAASDKRTEKLRLQRLKILAQSFSITPTRYVCRKCGKSFKRVDHAKEHRCCK